MPRFLPVDYDPFAPGKYDDFRRSDDVEDRRKEHFGSRPQADQKPNVFADGLMIGLDRDQDFHPAGELNELSKSAGADVLEAQIQRYLSDRAPGKSPLPPDDVRLVAVDHDPFTPGVQ